MCGEREECLSIRPSERHAHMPDLYARALRNIYDELFELDIVRNTYKIVWHAEHKYATPALEGTLDVMLRNAAEHTVHPEDKQRFRKFFAMERLQARFDAGTESLTLEYRKLLERGGYIWVQATVLPLRNAPDESVICCILDVNQRKKMEEKNAMLRELCNVAVENEYEFVCLIRLSTLQYVIYAFGGVVEALPTSGDYAVLLRILAENVAEEDRSAYVGNMELERVAEVLAHGNGSHTVTFRSVAGGTPRWMSTRMSYFKNDRDMILCTTRDIHDTYTAKEKERAIAGQFLQSFGSMYTDIVELDPAMGQAVIVKSGRHPESENSVSACATFLETYCKESLYEEDRAVFLSNMSVERLEELLKSGKTQKSFELRCLVDNAPYEWMELSAFVIDGVSETRKKILFTVRNINEQRLLKSIVNQYVYNSCDYFIYLDVRHDNYIMFSGSDNGTPLPPAVSDDYSGELVRYAETYVAPEDRDRVIAEMRVDRVVAALNEAGKHILYCGVKEANGYARKRLEYVYYDKRNKMVLLTRTDVTHMYREEQQKNELLRNALEAAETANRAKTDFLSRMSHDIRTPMNAIMGMTAIAQAKSDNRELVGDCLEKIQISSRYLLALINDVLDMSRIESGVMTLSRSTFNFAEFTRNLVAIIYPQAKNCGVAFEMTVQEPLADWYVGDALRINQILVNLLSNSLRYTLPGGSVRLNVRETWREEHAARLEFTVADTGCGMSPAFMAKMYEPFEQEHADAARNRSGTGLGLSIVRHLVTLMGGVITARSTESVGTTFIVTLDLEMPEGRDDGNAVEVLIGSEKYRVLVGDDDACVLENAVALLNGLGADAVGVTTGGEALARLRESRTAGVPFAAALLDVDMPGMVELAVVRELRRETSRDALTVILTGYDWTDIEEDAETAGIDAFLSKPLLRSAVFAALAHPHGKPIPGKTNTGASQRFSGQRVLLVEDNDINMEIARNLLEFAELRVDTAQHGGKALEMFRQSPAGYYDVILMDIRMPVMDGVEATRAIRALDREDAATVPIVAMSANAFQEDVKTALEAGITQYLVKPLEVETLYRQLASLL